MILHVPPDLSIGKTQEEETKQVWDTYDGVPHLLRLFFLGLSNTEIGRNV